MLGVNVNTKKGKEMSSKQAKLLSGQHSEVCHYLDQTECTEGELRAALLNAFRRIEQLEKTVAAMQLNEQTLYQLD